MPKQECPPYILGLDLGVASIGWTMIECDTSQSFAPVRLLRAKAHRFESGTDGGKAGAKGISQGSDEPRNKARRDARMMRRQIWRRAMRKRKLLRALFDPSVNLLPTPDDLAARHGGEKAGFSGHLKRPEEIHAYMLALDKEVSARWSAMAAAMGDSVSKHADNQRLCYKLREAAARVRVERHEFGRALYHLAQRRGFLSNRRAARKKDENVGDVLQSIDALSKAIYAFGARGGVPTLGAYLASLDPFVQTKAGEENDPSKQRIRHRWTSRKMFEHEFNLMWSTQAAHMGLSDPTRANIHRCIFFQRPLREPKRTVGTCFLMPDQARLKLAHPLYQEFRIRQTVNDLRVRAYPAPERALDGVERKKLVDRLMSVKELTFAQARKAMGLAPDIQFSHERTVVKTDTAHRGAQTLKECFGLKMTGAADAVAKSVRNKVGKIVVECDTADTRPFTADESSKLCGAWIAKRDLTVDEARASLGMGDRCRFLVVKETSNKLIGNKTAARIRAALKKSYDDLSIKALARLVGDLCSPLDDPSLKALLERPKPEHSKSTEEWLRMPIAERGWGFDAEAVAKLVKIVLEEKRGSLSARAIRQLLPLMQDGKSYAEAVKDKFPGATGTGARWDQLPPLACFEGHTDTNQCHQKRCGVTANIAPVLRGIRNPSVMRTLSEVRKLVNELVRLYGVPALIRIELSRDLKNPRLKRKEMTAENDRRQDRKEIVKERIRASMSKHGVDNPSEDDVVKWMLADECKWNCPYTQTPVCRATIFRDFDVEHIWPLSRWLDDSLMNKTLCLRDFNRKSKGSRIPSEALNAEALDKAVQAIKGFNADRRTRAEKLRRFEAKEVDKDFTNRHLADTRYISKAAAAYLGLLYGGVSEPSMDGIADGTRRIYPGNGRLTAFLRTLLGVSRILGKTPKKNREDHRHHAIDAILIALSDPKWSTKVLQAAARKAEEQKLDRHFEPDEHPVQPESWKGTLRSDVERAVNSTIVSHRESRKVSGQIHKDTTYSRDKAKGDHGDHAITLRKPIESLTASEVIVEKPKSGKECDVPRIRDKRVLSGIHELLRSHGLNPTDANMDGSRMKSVLRDFPIFLPGHAGMPLRVRHVRVVQSANPIPLGKERDPRLVMNADNHHTVIFSCKDDRGNDCWGHECVMLKTAYDRLAAQRAAFRANLNAAISDPKLLRRATHERPLADAGLREIVANARRRAVAEHPIVRRDLGAGRKFEFSLAKGDHLQMHDPDDGTPDTIFRVLSISEKEIKIIRTADNRKEAISGVERERPNADRLRKLGAKKVTLTRLGEVRRTKG